MHGTWKTIPLLFLLLLCGARQMSAQEAGVTQDEAVRKLQTRMDELKAQMAEIQSELNSIHPTKLPETGSIVSTPPPPVVKANSGATERSDRQGHRRITRPSRRMRRTHRVSITPHSNPPIPVSFSCPAPRRYCVSTDRREPTSSMT